MSVQSSLFYRPCECLHATQVVHCYLNRINLTRCLLVLSLQEQLDQTERYIAACLHWYHFVSNIAGRL